MDLCHSCEGRNLEMDPRLRGDDGEWVIALEVQGLQLPLFLPIG